MPKSRTKSQAKSSKRSPAKGKLAAKASVEEWNSAVKTVKEQKPFSHFVLEFFLSLFSLLWELCRKLFSSGRIEKNKEPSLSLERLDAASSSSALAAPYGTSFDAKRTTEGPEGDVLSFGTVNDPCDDPNWTGHSNEAWISDPEVVEAVLSRNGVMVGEIFCPDRVGYRKLKKEEAKVDMLARLPLDQIEDDEIKYERSGSDSEDWKKKYFDDKEIDDLTVKLRQVLSNFGEKPEGKKMEDGIKEEVLKLPAAKIEKIDMILGNALYTKILRAMHFQGANMALKLNFCNSDWRTYHRFPKFSDDADYQWWEQNFDPQILERRLEILRVAAKNWNPKFDIFMIIKLVSDLNSRLHPQPSENELNEEDEVKMSRLLNRICDLRSGGDSKL